MAVAVADNLDIKGRLLAKAPVSTSNHYYHEIRAAVLFATTIGADNNAYKYFCQLAQRKQLGTMKRAMFKAVMQDLVRYFYGVGLKRDRPNAFGKQQEAWKGVRLIEAEVLTG